MVQLTSESTTSISHEDAANGLKVDERRTVLGKEKHFDSETDSDSESLLAYKPTILYQNCSWQKTAGLLFSEYICLAAVSFPWSFSVLGIVPGLLITVFIAVITIYTGFIITDFCIKHPGVTSVCDISQILFWNSKVAWWVTAAMFVCNNTLIQALHVLVGAKYFNTISGNYVGGRIDVCSIVFGVVSAVICFIVSLPRTFHQMSFLGYFAAGTMFVSMLLTMIFSGVQAHPQAWVASTPVKWHVWPEAGTTYVDAMVATMNIVYTLAGQITYPSFISQMKEPRDFKKAVTLVGIAEIIMFSLVGSIVYVYVGDAYMTAPAFGSLTGNYKKIAFSFALPTILYLGGLYSNVTSQFAFEVFFASNRRHKDTHTILGWTVWIGLNFGLWAIAFVVAEAIPFFSDLLSLMSSLFDCYFGFAEAGVAYFRLRAWSRGVDGGMEEVHAVWEDFKTGSVRVKAEYITNVILILIGFYVLGPGLYSTVQSIINSYKSGDYGSAFTCVSNAI